GVPVENGDAEMTSEEPWDQKDDEATEEEPGGGDRGPEESASPEDPAPEMMEEEEEVLVPKVPAVQPDAPKKEHINVVFIGHVDAGKSTIGGQIMYLTGMVDKRTLEKYEREAKEKNRETWYLSWALDTNQEERDKGKTVEVGRAYFETDKKHFTILDAPGHKSFVPNMIGGASQADLAVLVISARKGEFETGFEKGGQTREHAMLAKTAGVKHLIVLVNKMDDPTVNWSLERYEECKEKLVPFLKKVGFNPKKDIHFMPCSGLTGANLKEATDMCPWYTGLPFIPHLDSLPNFNRSSDGPVRLPIVDKYKDMGTVVLGKLESGSISKAQQLVMMPNRVRHPIRYRPALNQGYPGNQRPTGSLEPIKPFKKISLFRLTQQNRGDVDVQPLLCSNADLQAWRVESARSLMLPGQDAGPGLDERLPAWNTSRNAEPPSGPQFWSKHREKGRCCLDSFWTVPARRVTQRSGSSSVAFHGWTTAVATILLLLEEAI
uniref:G1 to S phase transition 1 n=1 Tax=Poecilia latipinna TaxID=48699 RepID=A0A3B3TXW3_9TELE